MPEGLSIIGVVLADQIKSLDWRRRNARPVVMLPRETTDQILLKIGLLLAG